MNIPLRLVEKSFGNDSPAQPRGDDPRVAVLILDTVTRGRQELRRLNYLAVPPPL